MIDVYFQVLAALMETMGNDQLLGSARSAFDSGIASATLIAALLTLAEVVVVLPFHHTAPDPKVTRPHAS